MSLSGLREQVGGYPMKRITALCGALLLTLVLAAPAAANQKVTHVPGFSGSFDFEFPVLIADGWDFQCNPGPIYYGSYGSEDLTLWYAKGETRPLFPEDGAWPWIKGLYDRQGVDYFSSQPGMAGLVASGKFNFKSHSYDHYLGSSAPGDYETWTEKLTGKTWGIQLPGLGTVFHESGNFMQTVTVTDQSPANEIIVYETLREWRGNQTFDVEELCGFFGLDAEFAPPPGP